MLRMEPFIRPNLIKDCFEYSEQVGEYLQVGEVGVRQSFDIV